MNAKSSVSCVGLPAHAQLDKRRRMSDPSAHEARFALRNAASVCPAQDVSANQGRSPKRKKVA